MKKISKYVLFPLVLCATCIACGGGLALINFVVHDKIVANGDIKVTKSIKSFFKDNKGYEKFYDKNDNSDFQIIDDKIEQIYKVITADDKTGLVYKATTTSAYSGVLTLSIAIYDGAVIGIKYIGGTEDSLGVNAVIEFSNYINSGHSYELGASFDDLVVESGASAKKTFPAVDQVLKLCLEDSKNHVVVDDPNIFTTSIKTLSLATKAQSFEVTVTAEGNKFGNMKALITTDAKTFSKQTVTGIEFLEKDGTEGSGYGETVLNGTATDAFTTTLVAPLNSATKLPIKLFKDTLKTFEKNNPEIYKDNKAQSTSRAYYAMMNAIYLTTSSSSFYTYEVVKADDTKYTISYNPKNSFGAMTLEVDLNASTRKIQNVVFKSYAAYPVEGEDDYGMDIIDKNPNPKDPSRKDFINTYVIIPTDGLSFDLFNKDPFNEDDLTFKTGATETTVSYYNAIKLLIQEIEKGDSK